jgi:hypothetical protein
MDNKLTEALIPYNITWIDGLTFDSEVKLTRPDGTEYKNPK